MTDTAHGRVDVAGLARLAEFVAHLTECASAEAYQAVQVAAPDGLPPTHEDRLGVVARALVDVKRRIDLRDTIHARPA